MPSAVALLWQAFYTQQSSRWVAPQTCSCGAGGGGRGQPSEPDWRRVWLQMAAAVGGLTWLSFDMAAQQPSLLGVSCGVVAGLVGVTPAISYISVVGAMVMALVATSASWCAPRPAVPAPHGAHMARLCW